MYQKIQKMIKDLELRGRSNDTIKNRVYKLQPITPEVLISEVLITKFYIVSYGD